MIVIAIIGILSASLYQALTSYLQRGRDVVTQTNIQKVYDKLSEYLNDKGEITPMLMGNTAWYCISLQPPVDPNCFLYVPSIETFPKLSSKDFSISGTGLVTPLVQKVGINETQTGKLFPSGSNTTGKYQYILHWFVPGLSDGTPGVLLPMPDLPIANGRCKPGVVRWIDGRTTGENTNGRTGCEILVSY